MTFYTGAVKRPEDSRDRKFEDVLGKSPVVLDKVKGWDIRNEIGTDLIRKNQGSSSSCVGQGWSYQIWVFQILDLMKQKGIKDFPTLEKDFPKLVDQISAKAIYSQIRLPQGGAYIYSGGKLAIKWGAVFESIVSSYIDGKPPDEEFMSENNWESTEITKEASYLKGKDLRSFNSKTDMDMIATAMLLNNGVVTGLRGEDNNSWLTERPQPPTAGNGTWGHSIFFGAFGTDENGFFIASPNSWGLMPWMKPWEPGVPPGYGMQKFYSNYFTDEYMFDPWTFTDIPNVDINVNNNVNKNTMNKLIKGDKSSEIYSVGIDGLLRHIVGGMVAVVEGAKAGQWDEWTGQDGQEVPQEQVDAMPKSHSQGFLI